LRFAPKASTPSWKILRAAQPAIALAFGLVNKIGGKKATVAVARKLAVILHRMWCDASTFRWAEQGRAWRFSLTALFGLWVLKSLPSIGASYPRRNACPRIFSIQFL
jgi:hypothetical protein